VKYWFNFTVLSSFPYIVAKIIVIATTHNNEEKKAVRRKKKPKLNQYTHLNREAVRRNVFWTPASKYFLSGSE
jgi:hypothetical protein